MADRTCSVDGCDRPMRAGGMCTTHYQRLRTVGTLDMPSTCGECGDAIEYRGKGRRQVVCAKDECQRKYQCRKSTEWRQRNPEKSREAKRKVVAKNPEKYDAARKRRHLRREYGLAVEEYDAMVAAQGGSCAVCREPSDKLLRVDHNHDTGAVRALLCNACNLMLGLAKDDPSVLLAAAEYLSKHSS